MKFLLLLVLLFTTVTAFTVSQIHTAWTGKLTQRSISFVTPNLPNQSPSVQYGTSPSLLNSYANGTNFLFQAGSGNSYYINVVTLENLQTNVQYYYRAGDANSNSWSQVIPFNTKTTGFTYAVFGDLGTDNDVSLNQLLTEIKQRNYDAVIHTGDLAYDLDANNGATGDQFMNNIEPIASSVPYMTAPGNHENNNNFTHYINRFALLQSGVATTSGSGTNLWYSWDTDLVHFISIDTELYYYYPDPNQIQRQINWLTQDLINANNNRAQVPWIIMFGHKASWMPNTDWTDFLHLSHDYGVDIYLSGHEHNYQRTYPFHKSHVDLQNNVNYYVNPLYMFTLVSGSAGNYELIGKKTAPSEVLATYSLTYGFGHLQVFNATHLHWQWEQTGTDGAAVVLDDLWVSQSSHGPRLYL
eukprot:TRINITY_DN1565_c0_g1_i1.p1 TRINITY_DN1565_c0_g1~~TRINITY_DN1565_c0_g1_i1.p1  ORF type:complete len:413 (+),score=52.36 TRINITY_DN1565_c0_g1_i1:61-1299(+)